MRWPSKSGLSEGPMTKSCSDRRGQSGFNRLEIIRQLPQITFWRNTRLYPADRRLMSVAIFVSYRLSNSRIASRRS